MRDQAELDAAEVLTNPDVVTHPAGTQAEPSLAGAVSQLGPQAASTGGQRSQIPASSWDTPERQTVLTRRQREENTRDDVVPTYYIERKRQRSSIAERKEEEGGLMSELNAGILSEGLAADMRVREEKIPVEVRIPHEGTVRHPSGFEPPTPETEFHPTAAKVATEDHPVIATKKIQWHDSEIIRGANGNGNGNGNGKGNTSTSSSGARGLHTSAVLRALAVSDSTFGFMSPSVMRSPAPARDASLPQPPRQATRQQDAFKLDEDDEVDVNAVGNPAAANAAVQQVRSEYLPTLAETPFWRPLLSVSATCASTARTSSSSTSRACSVVSAVARWASGGTRSRSDGGSMARAWRSRSRSRSG
ncbi:uncharacterized protein B0H18DRAFT_76703 [Fomitopsis serialis]|uniref:uncharacterized protein n=1 Tax=Fomitopsis serialis TaxID=139415 RepID=UPI002008CB9B|nr:uncharacterized protein B0H18DRAFT_76703 [Neoantrodia serialis]KAH9916083.1 hypothetical protein B0H18DRAFT_76703 [Neoantrodia serialis]